MKDSPPKIIIILSALLIMVNIGIFIFANTTPIYWQQEEIVLHGFFWSMDGLDDFNLHTLLKSKDFLKPFSSYYVDGIFRTRQVSYFFEMVSFKFWQYFGKVFFQNYTLIGIHILNTMLLWLLVFRITKARETAWVSSLLFLNSGVALATLLFPFRNAKLLVMTFFLIGWLIIAYSKGKFCASSFWRIFSFLLAMVLAFFTDEIAFFIFPLLFFYIGFRDGFKELFHRRIVIAMIVSFVIWILLVLGALHMVSYTSHPNTTLGEVSNFIHNLSGYLINPQSYQDIVKAFSGYFLRRNFGYWDLTPFGIAAGVSACLLMISIFWGKPKRFQYKLCLILGIFIILKAILLPHNAGYHNTFMPKGTVFPSLFFFSYYYVYCEAVLLSLGIALLLHRPNFQSQRFVFLIGLVTIISLSNAIHLREGPPDALKNGNWWNNAYRRKVVKSVISAGEVLKKKEYWPLYLSFPSGNESLVKGRRTDEPTPNRYLRYIVTRYLRSFEQGRGLVSLDNVQPKIPFNSKY